MSAVIKPGSVSQADAKALVAYIKTLKAARKPKRRRMRTLSGPVRSRGSGAH